MKKTVPYITGDGVGVEITPSMQAIVNAAVKKAYGNEHEIEWMETLARFLQEEKRKYHKSRR